MSTVQQSSLSTSIAKKFWMALSGLFLILFLLQHMTINMLSVISPDMFNEVSQFMGTNPLVQFLLQPILIFGFLFHLVMGIVLDAKNRKARPVKYHSNKASANSSWVSRNMIITGMMVMAFLVLHFYDFWIHEMNVKYVQGDLSGMMNGEYRYYPELVEKFHDPIRVGIYIVSFILLSLHLMHGFQSAFQSVGFRNKTYTPFVRKLGTLYAVAVPAGFVVIALFHFVNSL